MVLILRVHRMIPDRFGGLLFHPHAFKLNSCTVDCQSRFRKQRIRQNVGGYELHTLPAVKIDEFTTAISMNLCKHSTTVETESQSTAFVTHTRIRKLRSEIIVLVRRSGTIFLPRRSRFVIIASAILLFPRLTAHIVRASVTPAKANPCEEQGKHCIAAEISRQIHSSHCLYTTNRLHLSRILINTMPFSPVDRDV